MFAFFVFNLKSLSETLPIMGKGMFGIFLVTGVIILSIYLLEKSTGEKKKQKK
ncbi:MAG: hypothetical protein ACOX45_01045 [Acutalibacteraceae bacterium]